MLLWEDVTAIGGPARVEPAPANFVDWRARSRSFEGIAAFNSLSYNLTGDGEPERLAALRTTPNPFAILGLQGAPTLTRLISTFLFGVSPTDPATFIAAALLLMLVAGLAAYVPARRAAGVDPAIAMRGE